MNLDWLHSYRLPLRNAWRTRRSLVFGCAILWGLGLAAAAMAEGARADRQEKLVATLTRLQKLSRWEIAQLTPARSATSEPRMGDPLLPQVRPGSRPTADQGVEIAQAGELEGAEIRELLAQNTEPAAEDQPTPMGGQKPAETLSGLPLADAPSGEATLSLNDDTDATHNLPEVPKVDEELAGIAGGESAKPAAGSIEAAIASVADPSDAISDPDERRVARAAFEKAGDDFAAGRWQEAKTGYDKVLELLPKHPAALVNLGLVEERLGNDKAARDILERALAVQPDAQPALMSLGLLYSKSGELSKAMARLTRLIELNPQDATAHNHLGVVFAQKNWREAAEAEFRTAIELNPLYQQAHFNLALMCLERNPPAVELARRHYAIAKQLGAKPDKEVEAMLASAVSILPGEKPRILEESSAAAIP